MGSSESARSPILCAYHFLIKGRMFSWSRTSVQETDRDFQFLNACRYQLPHLERDRLISVSATMALLFSVTFDRTELQDRETHFLQHKLEELFGISEHQSNAIIQPFLDGKIRISIKERVFYYDYINEHFTRKEKNALLRLLFEIAAADKIITIAECATISRLAKSLHLSVSEYEIARLPYTSILESKEAGTMNKRGFERIELPVPVTVEYGRYRKSLKLEDISLSGLLFYGPRKMRVHTPFELILFHYYSFSATILRSGKEPRGWEIAAEFDLDEVSFSRIKRLISLDDYDLDQCLSPDVIELLERVPFQLMAYLLDHSLIPAKSAKNQFLRHLATSLSSNVHFTRMLLKRVEQRQAWIDSVIQGTWTFDVDGFHQIRQELQTSLPEELAMVLKLSIFELGAMMLQGNHFWNRKINESGQGALREIASWLDINFQQWWTLQKI